MKTNLKIKLLLSFILPIQFLSAQIFTESPNNSFINQSTSEIAFSDIDNDGDQDVLMNGSINPDEARAILYTNDEGVFTEVTGTPFFGTAFGTSTFVDIDNDGDEDLIMTGSIPNVSSFATLYTNDGGVFTEVTGTPFEGVALSSVAFSDVDGDNDQDLLIVGQDNAFERTIALYLNDGTGTFTETDTSLPSLRWASAVFSDVDNDGDQDLMLSGDMAMPDDPIQPFVTVTMLYTNDGTGIFTEVSDTPFIGGGVGDTAFVDVDNDGDDDFLLTGEFWQEGVLVERVADLYINDGTGIFTEETNTPFIGVNFSSIVTTDLDNDGDIDILITGRNNNQIATTALYANEGGIFTEITIGGITDIFLGGTDFSDIDNDGDQDVIISGQLSNGDLNTQLFINNGQTLSVRDNLSPSSEFTIYPNPVSEDEVHILSERGNIIDVNVFDLNGRLLNKQPITNLGLGNNFSIDISKMSSGIYFLHIDNGSKIEVKKLLIR